jgi:hypothetical protein
MTDKVCKDHMRLLCSTKIDANDNFGDDTQELDRWYDRGSFVTVLPSSIILSPMDAQFRVNVSSVSIDFSPLNIDEQCKIYVEEIPEIEPAIIDDDDDLFVDATEPTVYQFSIDPCHCSNIVSLLGEFEAVAKKSFVKSKKKKLKLSFLDKKQRVRLECKQVRVKFSPKLARILGFDHNTMYQEGTSDAERLPDIYVDYRPLYLCSKCLAEPTYSRSGEMPLLRQIYLKDPATDTDNGRQSVIIFDTKHWVSVPGRRLHAIDFYLLCSDMSTPAQLLRNSSGCVIELELERDKLHFP